MARPKIVNPIPTKRIHLNAEIELHDRLTELARKERMSLASYCLRILEKTLEP